MTSISRLYFNFFVLLSLSFNTCRCFKVLNFHDFCGEVIYDEAGEVRFDAQIIPVDYHKNKCSVTVKPKSEALTGTTQALFYFTKFELTGPCGSMNVSVLDGSYFGGTPLNGLPEFICGHNTTLEEQGRVFTTTSDQFTVTFRGNDPFLQVPGNFTIKFITFTSGECEGQGVLQCPNDRCVASEYACSDDVNACGADRSQCDILEELQKLLELIIKTIKNYIWVVALIFALCILKSIYKKKREAICRFKNSVRSKFRNRPRNSNNTSRRSSVDNSVLRELVQIDEPVADQSQIHLRDFYVSRPAMEPRENDFQNLQNIDIQSAHSDDINMTSLQHSQINAPPPSYDEVIRNTNKYKSTSS